MNTSPVTTKIKVASSGPSTYLWSREAFDARNRWAQAQRPGSTWAYTVAIGNHTVASVGGFATHGKAVAAMYQARPRDYTSVVSITADVTTWDVYTATSPKPGYGKGKTGPAIGTARVELVDATTTTTITGEIADLLIADGWAYRWANTPNHLGDEYGNTVAIYTTGEPEEPIKVEFEYALPGGCVETLNLDPTRGAHRIAAVIATLAMPI